MVPHILSSQASGPETWWVAQRNQYEARKVCEYKLQSRLSTGDSQSVGKIWEMYYNTDINIDVHKMLNKYFDSFCMQIICR